MRQLTSVERRVLENQMAIMAGLQVLLHEVDACKDAAQTARAFQLQASAGTNELLATGWTDSTS